MEKELLSVQLECTMFLHENPYTFETAEGMALRLGRPKAQVEIVLKSLAAMGIVEEIQGGSHKQARVYRYIRPYEKKRG